MTAKPEEVDQLTETGACSNGIAEKNGAARAPEQCGPLNDEDREPEGAVEAGVGNGAGDEQATKAPRSM